MSSAAANLNGETPDPDGPAASVPRAGFLGLTLGSVGVVYGDIGTSPIYALREALLRAGVNGLTRAEVLGVVSLLLWALMLVVTVKYVLFLLRADNNGEGGMLSLMALIGRAVGRRAGPALFLGIAGAALFYGDAMITPAISILSAVEGLKLVTPVFEPYVLPISLAIIFGLFAVQSHGTARVGALFGPVCLVWFVVMAGLGLIHIRDDPGILAAFSPLYGIGFLVEHGLAGLIVLGTVFLAVTGAEALYADMGHFGRRPIQVAWLALVFPALALNYLGQGALVLKQPEAMANPFFLLGPPWLLPALVLLATAATVIASQAVITGAYSLSRQAIQLGLLPRLEIRYTSEAHAGQIFMPQVNLGLLIGVVLLVLLFETSGALADAYGIAVSGTMAATTTLAFLVAWRAWGWPLWKALLVVVPFLVIDLAFLGANLLKLFTGGWVPLVLAIGLSIVMWTWVRGSRIIADKIHQQSVPLRDLLRMLSRNPPHRVPGTAVFLTGDPEIAPSTLLHNLKHNKVLHETNVILTVRTVSTPRVAEGDRIELDRLEPGVEQLSIAYGYMETPDVARALVDCRRRGLKFDIMSTSFFLGRRSILPSAAVGMPLWQDKLYILLAKYATNATEFFHIPTDRVVELGNRVTV